MKPIDVEVFKLMLDELSFEEVCRYERAAKEMWLKKRAEKERERVNTSLKTMVMCYKLYPDRFEDEGTTVEYTEYHMITSTRRFQFKDFAMCVDVMDTDDVDLNEFISMASEQYGEEEDRRDDSTLEDYTITVYDVPREIGKACGFSGWQSQETYCLKGE